MNTVKNCVRLFSSAESCADGLGAEFKILIGIAMVGLAVLTSGCEGSWPMKFGAAESKIPSKMVKITAVGYGAASANDGYTPGQKKLMAMRASKLDAYRALAEQVQGVRVNGNSTVATMIAQNDSFRVYLDAYLRGAQLITVTAMPDGNYETTMELTLDERFFGGFAQQTGTVYSGHASGAVGAGYAYGGHSE
jgi:hypothetical protein